MFKTELRTRKMNGKLWQLIEPLVFEYQHDDGTTETITVPAGTLTDFATVPRIPFIYAATGNTAHKAATLHDYLYSISEDRKHADKVFYQAMRITEPRWRATIMYAAVRIFGRFFYSSRS